jgi:CHAT domain-containing protein
VEAAIASWRRQIQRGGGEVAPELLRRRLWDPLGAEVHGAGVVLLAPDGPLCELPFAALPGSRPGTYLIEDVALALAPAPLLVVDRRRSMTEMLAGRDSPLYSVGPLPAVLETPLLVGGVDYGGPGGDDLPALPATAREVGTIRRLFGAVHPGAQAELLTGKGATVAAVREKMVCHPWLHLATHGFYAPLRSAVERDAPELRSGLVLAGGRSGRLTALEVSGLNLTRADLVVLSACETGLGQTERGEGVLGLQRAFLLAGARGVVASLWEVPDEATEALMTRLYANLWQRKRTRLEALRDAQLWLLKEGRRHPEVVRGLARRGAAREDATPLARGDRLPPLYWAAFVLSGDWR